MEIYEVILEKVSDELFDPFGQLLCEKNGDPDFTGDGMESWALKFSSEQNVELMFKILNNDLSVISSKNMILANSSIALLVSGQVTTLDEGIELANESIVSGQAYSKLKGLVKRSNGDLSKLEILEKKYGFHH